MKNIYLIEKDNIKNIYITNDEEIKNRDYVLSTNSIGALYLDGKINTTSMLAENQWNKIILTTDQDLIKDGVQSIDDEFLEWFVNNPGCEEVELISVKSDTCNCYYPKFCKSTMLDYKTHCDEDEDVKEYYKIIIAEENFIWVGVLNDEKTNYIPYRCDIKHTYQGDNCLPNFKTEEECQNWCDNNPPFTDLKESIVKEILEHKSKFIVFTFQDSEDWTQESIPLNSFEEADEFCQHLRNRKISYLICKTLKQGYNGN